MISEQCLYRVLHNHKLQSLSLPFSENALFSDIPQAPQVVGAEGEFTVTSGDGTPCLFQMVLQFNTDTSAPMVEIQKGLDSLLTFAPASLAKTPHRGYWRDYKTLVIQFKECVQWNRDERKPLYVVFYGSGGNVIATHTDITASCVLAIIHSRTSNKIHSKKRTL